MRSSELVGAILQLFKKSKTAASARASALASIGREVLILCAFRLVLLFNGGQFSLQYPQRFQSVHHIRHTPTAFAPAKSY